MTLDGIEIVPDEPRTGPQYILVAPHIYEMIKLASGEGFWGLDWRKRKRLFRRAAKRGAKT